MLLSLTVNVSAQYSWFTLPNCPNMLVMVDSFVNTSPTHRIGRIMMIVYPQADFSDSCLCEIPDSLYPGWEFIGGYRSLNGQQGFGNWLAGNFSYNTPPPTEIYFDSAQSRFEVGTLHTNVTFIGVYMQKPLSSGQRIASPGKGFEYQKESIYDLNGRYLGGNAPETAARLPKGLYIIIDENGNIEPRKIVK